MKQHVRIIAEVGSNYDGDLSKAKAYVVAAKEAGADAVKFQTLKKEKLVAPFVWEGGERKRNPVYSQFSSLELPEEWHFELKKTADQTGIEFISTPFFLKAVDLLERVGVKTYKIAAGDITFSPLLEAVGRTQKKVILSTGASGLDDIRNALDTLREAGAGDITLLHCVSQYPPKFDEMNLRAVLTLKETFGLPVGISDHTPGDLVPVSAVALGGTCIEKHVTFERGGPGPDHGFSMTMEEFRSMVGTIRSLEGALGSGEKTPSPSERLKQRRMRRGRYDPETFERTDAEEGIWLRPQHDQM